MLKLMHTSKISSRVATFSLADLRRNSQVQKLISWLEPVRRQTNKDGAERRFSAESSAVRRAHKFVFDFCQLSSHAPSHQAHNITAFLFSTHLYLLKKYTNRNHDSRPKQRI